MIERLLDFKERAVVQTVQGQKIAYIGPQSRKIESNIANRKMHYFAKNNLNYKKQQIKKKTIVSCRYKCLCELIIKIVGEALCI